VLLWLLLLLLLLLLDLLLVLAVSEAASCPSVSFLCLAFCGQMSQSQQYTLLCMRVCISVNVSIHVRITAALLLATQSQNTDLSTTGEPLPRPGIVLPDRQLERDTRKQ
jgi:hypothetical protein